MTILGWLLLGFAVWAWLAGDEDAARHFVLMAMLVGVSAQISQLRGEVRK